MSQNVQKALQESIKRALGYSIEQGLIDLPCSRKRLNGLEDVLRRMPKDTREALPPLIIFSPPLDVGGATYRREIPLSHAFVYLSPTLEKELFIDATWAVAHELAHVVLGHGHLRERTPEQRKADEKAASDLADAWGVPKRNPKQSRCLDYIKIGEEVAKLVCEQSHCDDYTEIGQNVIKLVLGVKTTGDSVYCQSVGAATKKSEAS